MDLSAISASPPAIPSAMQARVDSAAKEFEALVLSEMLAPLFNSVETPGIAGGGPGEKAFSGLLQEEYAKAIAARGGFGIADQVKAALIGLQAARPHKE